VTNDALNALFSASWPDHQACDHMPILSRSLAYVCAYREEHLVGYVNVAWDGGVHAFLLDTSVHPGYRRRGIGRELVRRAAAVARARGMEWLHVDYEPHLEEFYRGSGFRPTRAGLMHLIADKERTMKPKERVLAALDHREPDRVPTGENAVDYELVERILGHPTLYNSRWRERQALWDGRRAEIVADYGTAHVELVRALDWDYVRVPVVPPDRAYRQPVMTGPYSWLDEQGHEIQYHPDSGNIAVRADAGDMTLDDLPDPDVPYIVDPSELEAVRYVVRELGETHFVVGRSPIDGTFPFQATGGMEAFLVRMITDPPYVRRAIDAYVNRSIAYIEAMLDAGCDAIMTTDDYSDNRGPIMGPARFQEYILPGLIRQVEAVHARGGIFIKHTDGNVWSILDMLIEAGIDGWHGIQPSIGMDLKTLQERYGDQLCFFGGVNCETLVAGDPEGARAEVRYAIQHAAPGGGLVVTTGNVLQPGTQLENYLAARQATREYGKYPIMIK
jgi:uroporphyrinogen decarboxylase